jgi:hypothetical protein
MSLCAHNVLLLCTTPALASYAVLQTSWDPNADPTWLADTRCGWAFMMATLCGISELSQCLTFYRGIGGHFWYDFWLGVALILGLPIFRVKQDAKKKAN